MKKREPFNLILLGDPASGKATHGLRLVKKYGFRNVDMGEELRKLNGAAGRRVHGKIDVGNLAPTDVVRVILERTLRSTPRSKGILFNGTPKMIGEAKLLAKLLAERGGKTLFVYLAIPQEETIRRMQERKRRDDTLLALRNRMRYYRKNIREVAEFFGQAYPHRKISSLGTKPAVFREIVRFLEGST